VVVRRVAAVFRAAMVVDVIAVPRRWPVRREFAGLVRFLAQLVKHFIEFFLREQNAIRETNDFHESLVVEPTSRTRTHITRMLYYRCVDATREYAGRIASGRLNGFKTLPGLVRRNVVIVIIVLIGRNASKGSQNVFLKYRFAIRRGVSV